MGPHRGAPDSMPGKTRTLNLQIRSLTLCPLSYRHLARNAGAWPLRGLTWRAARKERRNSGRRGSNPRPRPWQGRALPLSYFRAGSPAPEAPTPGAGNTPTPFARRPRPRVALSGGEWRRSGKCR
eukprot:scaffold3008_cov1771-Pavlova_lutheri.AAC.3